MIATESGQWVTLAQRPDLLAPAYEFDSDERSASFMQNDWVAGLATSKRISRLWPEFLLVLVASDGSVIARAVSVPFNTDPPGRKQLPDTGWDGIVMWCVEDALDGKRPTAAGALEIAVDPAHRGRGLSVEALHALRANTARLGLTDLVAPVRPPDKAKEPWTPFAEYVARTRADGLPSDRWLRVHVRAGGRIEAIAPFSMVVVGRLGDWREWTDLAFDQDGPVEVDGALQPVVVSQQLGSATYVEPNVWIRHRIAGATSIGTAATL